MPLDGSTAAGKKPARRVPGWYRNRLEPYLPYAGHASEHAFRLDDGSLMSIAEVRGIAHELRAASERNAAANILNRVWCDIGRRNVMLYAHMVREKLLAPIPSPLFRNQFSLKLWHAYKENVLRDLYTNTWFLTIIVSPSTVPIGSRGFRRLIARSLYGFRRTTINNTIDLVEIEDVWRQATHNLAEYNIRRLGYRYENSDQYPEYQYRFSEIGEAMRRFLGLRGSVPVVRGPLGRIICSDADQPVFERRVFRIMPPGCDDDGDEAEGVQWGTIFGLNDYMEETHPDLMDKLLALPMELVLAQSYGFHEKHTTVSRLLNKRKAMKVMGDNSIKQRKRLKKAAARVADGDETWGTHHISLAVRGSTYHEQLINAGVARAALVNTAADIAPESLGNAAAYYAQLPGNYDWATAPGHLSSETFVDFANFGAFPTGNRRARWGAGIPMKTTANTLYWYDPFAGECGMAAIFGATRSGKSTILCLLMAFADQYFVDKKGLFIVLDKDDGSKIFIEAISGKYLTVVPGTPSGIAPLRGFKESTSYSRACLVRLLRACILLDGLGPISPQDERRLVRGVEAVMSWPIELRTIERVRLFLGYRDPLGAGPRLERWCRGGALGWVLDGDEDLLDFECPAISLNFGLILDSPEVAGPLAQCVRDRITPTMDGRRVGGFFDEFHKYSLVPPWDSYADDFFRTWGKQNGMAMLATQQPEDMTAMVTGRAILGQCHTMWFCPSPSASEKVYTDPDHGIDCTRGEYLAVTRMIPGSRKVLIKRRGDKVESVICDLDLSALPRWYIDVLSGRTNTVRLWNELAGETSRLEQFAGRSKEAVD